MAARASSLGATTVCGAAGGAASHRRSTKPPASRPALPSPSPSRRALLLGLGAVAPLLVGRRAEAVGFKKEIKPRRGSAPTNVGDYTPSPDGAYSFFDSTPGSPSTPAIAPGDTVTVHFDAIFRGIDVASSRSARLLGGNRTIAEPFTFVAGRGVDAASRAARPAGDSAGGLFSGAAGPQPPPALSTAVLGMRAGGKRSVLIPEGSPAGYGPKGLGEIPPNGGFMLEVEVLEVTPGGGAK